MKLNNRVGKKPHIFTTSGFSAQKTILKIKFFSKVEFRVAVQKNGELTNISVPIICKLLNISLDPYSKKRRL